MAFRYAAREIIEIITIFGGIGFLFSLVYLPIAFLMWTLGLLFLLFFRDPSRAIPTENNVVVSPADGKIVNIAEYYHEDEYIKSSTVKIDIFMSIFDVHVNRIPVDGTVDYIRHQEGLYINAMKEEASKKNENTLIGLKISNNKKIALRQVAGLIARRIVTDLKKGQEVKKGERFGMIKFGSRLEVYIPQEMIAEVKVSLNQKVKSGETVLVVLKNDKTK